jgi:hypothetical protein
MLWSYELIGKRCLVSDQTFILLYWLLPSTLSMHVCIYLTDCYMCLCKVENMVGSTIILRRKKCSKNPLQVQQPQLRLGHRRQAEAQETQARVQGGVRAEPDHRQGWSKWIWIDRLFEKVFVHFIIFHRRVLQPQNLPIETCLFIWKCIHWNVETHSETFVVKFCFFAGSCISVFSAHFC